MILENSNVEYIDSNSMKINEQFNNIISSYYQNLKVDKSEKENIQFQCTVAVLAYIESTHYLVQLEHDPTAYIETKEEKCLQKIKYEE